MVDVRLWSSVQIQPDLEPVDLVPLDTREMDISTVQMSMNVRPIMAAVQFGQIAPTRLVRSYASAIRDLLAMEPVVEM